VVVVLVGGGGKGKGRERAKKEEEERVVEEELLFPGACMLCGHDDDGMVLGFCKHSICKPCLTQRSLQSKVLLLLPLSHYYYYYYYYY